MRIKKNKEEWRIQKEEIGCLVDEVKIIDWHLQKSPWTVQTSFPPYAEVWGGSEKKNDCMDVTDSKNIHTKQKPMINN